VKVRVLLNDGRAAIVWLALGAVITICDSPLRTP
jgi:hypothetical protein